MYSSGPLLALQVLLSKRLTLVAPKSMKHFAFAMPGKRGKTSRHGNESPKEGTAVLFESDQQSPCLIENTGNQTMPVAGLGFEHVNGYDSPIYGRVPGRWHRQFDRIESKGRSSSILPAGHHLQGVDQGARHRVSRSVPFLQDHWRAGNVEGDRVLSRRSGVERLLNLLSTHPKLEFLAGRAMSLTEELKEELEGELSSSSISMVDVELGPSQELLHTIIHKLERSINSARPGSKMPGALYFSTAKTDDSVGGIHARSRSEGAFLYNAEEKIETTARHNNDALEALIFPQFRPGLRDGADSRIIDDHVQTSKTSEGEETRHTAHHDHTSTTPISSCAGHQKARISLSSHSTRNDSPFVDTASLPDSQAFDRQPRRAAIRQRKIDVSTGAVVISRLSDEKVQVKEREEDLEHILEPLLSDSEKKGKRKQRIEAIADQVSIEKGSETFSTGQESLQKARTPSAAIICEHAQFNVLLSPSNRSLATELGLTPTSAESKRSRCLSEELGLVLAKNPEKDDEEVLESIDTVSPLKRDNLKRRSLGSEMGLKQLELVDDGLPCDGSPASSQADRRRTARRPHSWSKRSRRAESSSCGSILSLGTDTEIIISPDVTLERKGSIRSFGASFTEEEEVNTVGLDKIDVNLLNKQEERPEQQIIVLEGSYSLEARDDDEELLTSIEESRPEASVTIEEEAVGSVTSQCSVEEIPSERHTGALLPDMDRSESEALVRLSYQPGMPLELLEEVTEEPTVSEVSDVSLSTPAAADESGKSRNQSRLRSQSQPDDKNQKVAFTAASTPARAHGITQLLDRSWEKIHGLGTPSTPGDASTYGWAELRKRSPSPSGASSSLTSPRVSSRILASPRSTLRSSPTSVSLGQSSSLSKALHQQRLYNPSGYRTSLLSPFSSPQKVIGLNSSFWIDSPRPVRLELQSFLNSRSNKQLENIQSPSLSLRSNASRTDLRILANKSRNHPANLDDNDDEWIELEAEESEGNMKQDWPSNVQTLRRWKRMSAGSALSFASNATSTMTTTTTTTSESHRRTSNSSLILESLQKQVIQKMEKARKRRSLHEMWSGAKHSKVGTNDMPSTPTRSISSREMHDDTKDGQGAADARNVVEKGKEHKETKPRVRRIRQTTIAPIHSSVKPIAGGGEDNGEQCSSYNTDAASIKSCKRTSEYAGTLRSYLCIHQQYHALMYFSFQALLVPHES